MRKIATVYYHNIDPYLIKLQKQTFASLGYDIDQRLANNVPHGKWLTEYTNSLGEDDSVLFMDIDCIPLNKQIVEHAFEVAEKGGIFGAAQESIHLAQPTIYAAPMFLSFSKKTWLACDSVNLMDDERFDAAGALTHVAMQKGITIEMRYPTYCVKPMWVMNKIYPFGIGTFYEGDIFHLFRSRKNRNYLFLFETICNSVIEKRDIDYVKIYQEFHSTKRHILNLYNSFKKKTLKSPIKK